MDLMEIEFYSNAIKNKVYLEITMGCDIWCGWSEMGSRLSADEIKLIENNNRDAGMISELTEDWRNGR